MARWRSGIVADSRSMPRSTGRMATGPPRESAGFAGAAVAGPTNPAVTAAATPMMATVRNADGRGTRTLSSGRDAETGWTGRRTARRRPAGLILHPDRPVAQPLLGTKVGARSHPRLGRVPPFGAEAYGHGDMS